MKKIITIATIILVATALGWIGSNILADRAREAEPVGFDIGTRMTYQTRGIMIGAVAGILIASGWIMATRTKQRG